jgi:hypothetical protein
MAGPRISLRDSEVTGGGIQGMTKEKVLFFIVLSLAASTETKPHLVNSVVE